jgi:hypothetical protein
VRAGALRATSTRTPSACQAGDGKPANRDHEADDAHDNSELTKYAHRRYGITNLGRDFFRPGSPRSQAVVLL